MRLVCYERTLAKTYFIRVSWRLKGGRSSPAASPQQDYWRNSCLQRFHSLSVKLSITSSFLQTGLGGGGLDIVYQWFHWKKENGLGKTLWRLSGIQTHTAHPLLNVLCFILRTVDSAANHDLWYARAINSEISKTAKSISPLFWPSPRQAASCTSPRDIQDVFVNATHLASILGK